MVFKKYDFYKHGQLAMKSIHAVTLWGTKWESAPTTCKMSANINSQLYFSSMNIIFAFLQDFGSVLVNKISNILYKTEGLQQNCYLQLIG